MKKISVYDPALCCSTGVCGPSVDPKLVSFSADLDWLKSQGVSVSRYNLSQQPGAFVENDKVKSLLQEKGDTVLPILFVDGELKSESGYPQRTQLAEWAGVSVESKENENSGGCCGGKTSCC